ncbi:MAG: hypothetical protein R3C14_27910 [Caldilineaceae bacterium]
MQLPVWQDFYVANQQQGVELLAVAIDFQGAALPRPYVEQAKPTYANAVDTENLLGLHFGFRAVPNVVFVDEAGIIRYTKFGGFDIRKPADRQRAEAFATAALMLPTPAEETVGGFRNDEARTHFNRGLTLFQQGEQEQALAEWRKGLAYEPENWIIRKQIWAIEHPDKFYNGDVDFDWQREQIQVGQ